MPDIGELVIQIQASAGNLETVLNGAAQVIKQFAAQMEASVGAVSFSSLEKEVQGLGASTEETGKKAKDGWDALGKTAQSAQSAIASAIEQGIAAYQSYQAAMQGLINVATQQGIGPQAMQAALDKVTDAFLDSGSAATAYQNLLSRGFTLDQATETILRLKEAAALGRQSSQGFAQAVVSATAGIKSENSALVENAGVTKSVAKMWQEYAQARGMAANELTQGQKAEAEYLGIAQATAAQMGDLQKMSQTLAGDQAIAAQQSLLASQNFGEAMAPLVSAGEQMKAVLLEGLGQLAGEFPAVTAGATTAAAALSAMVSAASALKTIPALLSAIGLTASTFVPLAGLALVIGGVAAAYTALKKQQEEQARAEEERIAKLKESISTERDRIARLEKIKKRYNELNSQTGLSLSDSAELTALRREEAAGLGMTRLCFGLAA